MRLFANEKYEAKRFDGYLAAIRKHNLENTYAVAVLNVGQAAIFSLGLTAVMSFTAAEVARGGMSVGSIVAVNGARFPPAGPFFFFFNFLFTG